MSLNDPTANQGFQTPAGDEPIANYPSNLAGLFGTVDSRMVALSEGPLSALPPGRDGTNPVSASNPGNGRRLFRDTGTGTLLLDAVDHWEEYPPAPVGSDALADGSVTSAKIADGAIVDADVNAAAAIEESKLSLASDAAADVPSRRTLGTGATQAAAGDDSRLSDSRATTGAAGGDLGGDYPDPTVVSAQSGFTVGGTAPALTNDSRLSDQRTPKDGSVTASKLATSVADDIGMSSGGVPRRGYDEYLPARSFTSSRPDVNQVSVHLPQNGLIFVAFTALWRNDDSEPLDAWIELNGNLVKIWSTNQALPIAVQARLESDAGGKINSLTTTPFGLSTTGGTGTSMNGNESHAGMVVGHQYNYEGGPCCIWADAGAYRISITMDGRNFHCQKCRLWVWTMGF